MNWWNRPGGAEDLLFRASVLRRFHSGEIPRAPHWVLRSTLGLVLQGVTPFVSSERNAVCVQEMLHNDTGQNMGNLDWQEMASEAHF